MITSLWARVAAHQVKLRTFPLIHPAGKFTRFYFITRKIISEECFTIIKTFSTMTLALICAISCWTLTC